MLAEEHEREEDGEERLQVREERRARRADARDRGEPQDVRQEERPDHREGEAEPDQRQPKLEASGSSVCGMPTSASGTQPSASTSELIRNGE